MPTAKQLSECMEEFRCRSAQREYISTSRGTESAEFSFSASTLHQDSLRGNFPPSLPTSTRRPAAEVPLLLRGTSTHGRRSGDVGRLDRGRPSCSTRSLSSMRCCLTPGSSIVDLTFVCETLTPRVLSWTVSGLYTHSDHQAIVFEIEDDGASSRPSTRRSYRWNARTLDVDRFSAVVSSASVAPGTAEDMASSLMSVITGACDASISKANPRRRREPVYWWTAEIADLRRSCLRARRLFQRSRGRHEEETHSANYASARRLLRVAIKTSKRRCWRQLCDEVNNDVWGKPYRISMSRLGCPQAKQPSSPLLVRGAVAALFSRVPSEPALWLPRQTEEPIPAVTLEELKEAQSRIKERSAPGLDGIPNSALKIAIAARPDIFLRVYTMCLETGVFPSGWKRQRLVLLPKPGKPPDEPSSYRPLCMLDTAGTILERMICDRLEAFTERPGGLSERQYGFRKGRSTIDAIEDVISTAREAIAGKRWYRGTKKYCAVVTLDVRNAFNSARWDNILAALRRLLVPDYLLRIIASYFSARVLDFTTDEGPESYEVTAGVPQGSVLGPIMSNVMYDAILCLNFDCDVRIVGFADDIAVMAVAKHLWQIEHDLNAAILQEKRGNHHNHGRRPQHTLVPLHPLPGPAHRRQAEVRPPPPNSQRKGSRCDRCPYEDHAQLWRAQKQPTQAVCSRRRLHTPVRSPRLEHSSTKASLHSTGGVSPPTSLPACDRRPAACLLRGHICPCRHTSTGPSCGRASATLRPPPRGRRGRRTLGNAKQVTGSMGPIDEGPMDAPTDPKYQSRHRGAPVGIRRIGAAPGPDGIPIIALKAAVEACFENFRRVFTVCLRKGCFPTRWKRQRLVLMLKPGKPAMKPSSYRPLCMLDTAGKILEKIIAGRLETHTEGPAGLADSQYGFRKGRSTVDAIQAVLSTARSAISGKRWHRGTKEYCAIITLDVRNAFNSARWNKILIALSQMEVPAYLLRILSSYFLDRVLEFTTDDGAETYEVTAGMPQILRLKLPRSAKIVGFADDIAVTVVAKHRDLVEFYSNETRRLVRAALTDLGLLTADQKTEVLLVTSRKVRETITLKAGDHYITSAPCIRRQGKPGCRCPAGYYAKHRRSKEQSTQHRSS
ncbi:unnamed protein product [Trichogramma brassicae]|uniref:Reverse transcriptase domain-containing protein n=1 Tax=Trichogramma brassicae TaxID=86971 RepID=A0A6H5IRH3_9HYME|nr:unnamed protein product [Trichogramma brassicae]